MEKKSYYNRYPFKVQPDGVWYNDPEEFTKAFYILFDDDRCSIDFIDDVMVFLNENKNVIDMEYPAVIYDVSVVKVILHPLVIDPHDERNRIKEKLDRIWEMHA